VLRWAVDRPELGSHSIAAELIKRQDAGTLTLIATCSSIQDREMESISESVAQDVAIRRTAGRS